MDIFPLHGCIQILTFSGEWAPGPGFWVWSVGIFVRLEMEYDGERALYLSWLPCSYAPGPGLNKKMSIHVDRFKLNFRLKINKWRKEMTWIKNTFIDRRFASTRNWERRSQSRTQGRWKRIRIWGWAMTKTTIIQLSHYVNNDDSDCYFFEKGISRRKALREILQTKTKIDFSCLFVHLASCHVDRSSPWHRKWNWATFLPQISHPSLDCKLPATKKKLYFKITPLKLHSIKQDL